MNSHSPAAPVQAVPDASRHVLLDSRELLRGLREVQISHGDQIYRLSVTRQGKLILTK